MLISLSLIILSAIITVVKIVGFLTLHLTTDKNTKKVYLLLFFKYIICRNDVVFSDCTDLFSMTVISKPLLNL